MEGSKCLDILQEPAKADFLTYNSNPVKHRLPRVALCILQPPKGDVIVEALVAVSDIPPTVLSWVEVRHVGYF